MTNRALFKAAVEQQNKAARTLLQLRKSLVQDIRRAIPQDEKDQVCVAVTLHELRAVQSLDADDYRIQTQADVICETLMKCRTAGDLMFAVRGFVREGRVWNGRRYLLINGAIRKVLCQYAGAAGVKRQRFALAK